MRRRQFLTLSATSLGGLLVYSLDRKSSLLRGQSKRLRIPLRFFDEQEALIVASAASRIFPSDDSGPGAAEAGVTIYIDRQLAGPYGRDRFRYTQGPFENTAAELGYQGKATPCEIYHEGLKNLKGFDKLLTAEQDKLLEQIESSRFFALLRQHTIEGMFSDPIHGGNVDMVGWQLVGFPGPRMSNYEEIDKYFGQAFRPKPVSLREMTGIPIRPSEDQK
jgi:gluconate 2-dehydrogenase gamma chain